MTTAAEAWLAQHRQPELNEAERQFRDRFVTEYLIDYSPEFACLRMGFTKDFAGDYSVQYMADAYVLSEIKRREVNENVASSESDEGLRKRIKASLFREAHNQYAKPSSRVAALRALADIYGMNAPIKQEIKTEVTSNVRFYLPDNKRDKPKAAEIQEVDDAIQTTLTSASIVFPAREDSQ